MNNTTEVKTTVDIADCRGERITVSHSFSGFDLVGFIPSESKKLTSELMFSNFASYSIILSN